jgi:hypothetical protein
VKVGSHHPRADLLIVPAEWRLWGGHEGRFPPAKLNGHYRFRKRSVAVSDLDQDF